MNEKSFNNVLVQKEDPIGYDPNETVGSLGHKMKVKKQKELEETYKPTPEEEQVIKLLSIPILNKIKELRYAARDLIGKEKKMFDKGINDLFVKLIQIKMPQNMSKDDIKDLIFRANLRRDSSKEYAGLGNLYKISFLDKEIDFLLDQLQKRLK